MSKYHRCYLEFEADTHNELGLQLGQRFADDIQESLEWVRETNRDWNALTLSAKKYFAYTKQWLPNIAEEMQGLAMGAGVSLDDAWALSVEDELMTVGKDHCTTVVVNHGSMIAHNEDWDDDSQNYLYVVRKKIKDLSILELFYSGTLGGNAISINSHKYVQAINSLVHKDKSIGVPRNAVARWLSETGDLRGALNKFQKMNRSSGYHHFLCGGGEIISLEASASEFSYHQVSKFPYIHTNHYLSDLAKIEDNTNGQGSFSRYARATELAKSSMSLSQLKELMENQQDGRNRSIFNNNTIGRVIIDVGDSKMHVWLKREAKRGYVAYPIDV